MTQRSNLIFRLVNSTLKIEILAFLLAFISLAWTLDSTLLSGTTTLSHDAFYFSLPLFHHLVDSLQEGILPYWNPYTHAGEPIYPSLFHCQFYDPISISLAYFGPLFTLNRTLLFNWNHFIHSALMLIGTYLSLRGVSRYPLTRVLFIVILCFSSFNLASYRQIGFLFQFQWVPWIVWSFSRIFLHKKQSWIEFSLLGSFAGLQMQSYWFTGLTVLILCFGVSVLSFYRSEFQSTLNLRFPWKKLLFALGLVALALSPNLVLFLNQNLWYSPARISQKSGTTKTSAPALYEDPKMAQNLISHFSWDEVSASGSASNGWNFLQLFYPDGNSHIHRKRNTFGNPSEAWMYFGILPILMILAGFFFGSAPQKCFWMCLSIGTGLLMVGPNFKPNYFLFLVYPPLRFLRHYTTLVSLFGYSLLYFFILGVDWVTQKAQPTPSTMKSVTFSALVLVWVGLVFSYCNNPMEYLIYVLALGLLPFTGLFLLRKHQIRPLIPILFLILPIGFDLTTSSFLSSYIYKGQMAPELFLKFNKQSFPNHREPYPPYPYMNFNTDPAPEQSPRYLGIYYKRSYALSELMGSEGDFFLSFDQALKTKRWNSFLLQKSYYELLDSGIQPNALREIFSLYAPTLQLKDAAVLARSDQMATILNKKRHPVEFLQKNIFVHNDTLATLNEISSSKSRFESKVLSFNVNELVVNTLSQKSGFLYWSDGYDPNWRAYLDGTRIPLLRANINFKAVQIPIGNHQLRFTYDPKSFKTALLVFYFPILVSISLILYSLCYSLCRRLQLHFTFSARIWKFLVIKCLRFCRWNQGFPSFIKSPKSPNIRRNELPYSRNSF